MFQFGFRIEVGIVMFVFGFSFSVGNYRSTSLTCGAFDLVQLDTHFPQHMHAREVIVPIRDGVSMIRLK